MIWGNVFYFFILWLSVRFVELPVTHGGLELCLWNGDYGLFLNGYGHVHVSDAVVSVFRELCLSGNLPFDLLSPPLSEQTWFRSSRPGGVRRVGAALPATAVSGDRDARGCSCRGGQCLSSSDDSADRLSSWWRAQCHSIAGGPARPRGHTAEPQTAA